MEEIEKLLMDLIEMWKDRGYEIEDNEKSYNRYEVSQLIFKCGEELNDVVFEIGKKIVLQKEINEKMYLDRHQ